MFKNLEPSEVFHLISLHTEIFGESPDVLLLDEVQNLKDWSSVMRSLLDRNYKILISGSSSKLLSKEIATQLRGRTISYILLPASFKEFLNFKNFHLEKYLDLESEAKLKRYLNFQYPFWDSEDIKRPGSKIIFLSIPFLGLS